jgi:hypothetical protein
MTRDPSAGVWFAGLSAPIASATHDDPGAFGRQGLCNGEANPRR